jgi:hypothetical protein
MIFERLSGKLLHDMLWASPTQNCFVPIEQFLGIIALTVLGIAAAAVLGCTLNLAYRAWNEVSVSNTESVAVLRCVSHKVIKGDEVASTL